ncbi:cytokine receptor common subunit gamma [Rhinatrema bivittatum]|uniref:cytokine receptor common subunit gamma n=1 Tax=Rhinatrema bivittatum TaxID=194408 RepID=UPI00112E5C15|nr:cytokine receptor common subunit gamma [Rhinatrema bivittatum]
MMESRTFLLLSILCCPITAPAPAEQGLQCIVYNEDYMTCMWNGLGTPVGNYSLYYWYTGDSGSASECKRYIQQQKLNIGCNFTKSELEKWKPFHVQVKSSHGAQSQLIASSELKLQDIVKLDPPVNLIIRNLTRNQLLLNWKQRYNNTNCLQFQVRYQSNTDTKWTELEVYKSEFTYSSVDPEKQYTFQVRSKINQYCGSSTLWSDWSYAINWGKNTTIPDLGFSIQTLVTSLVSSLLVLFLLILLIRRERVWLIIVPNIPNPSKNFEELFQTHKGNFPEWAGVSKDIVDSFTPSYNETLCYVSEEPVPERGGETGLCLQPETKPQTVSSVATDLQAGDSQKLSCTKTHIKV